MAPACFSAPLPTCAAHARVVASKRCSSTAGSEARFRGVVPGGGRPASGFVCPTVTTHRRFIAPAATSESLKPEAGPTASIEAEVEKKVTEMTVPELKAALLENVFGTERGLSASSEVRGKVNECITALEALNPTTSPTAALETLAGTWTLSYTSNSELFLLLAADRVPLVSIGDITQTIDGEVGTVENKVEFTAPLVKSSITAQAAFEVRSPKRLSIRFESGTVAVPTLYEDIVLALPDSLTLMGQNIDLSALQGAISPVQEAVQPALKSAISAVQSVLSNQSDLKVPIPATASGQSQTWLLTTYLDEDTRIARGDGGSIFVLTKSAAIIDTVVEESVVEPVAIYEPVTPVAGSAAAVATDVTEDAEISDKDE